MALNPIKAVRDYITKMVRTKHGVMKVLLLDEETMAIVSMVYTQTEILQEEVYLFERIDIQNRESMPHLKAFCFLRPTAKNIEFLKMELSQPKYGEYYLFFTNALSKQHLESLAASDEHEVVQEVQEMFGDYWAVNQDTWSLNLPGQDCISVKGVNWAPTKERIIQGLVANLLSLKVRPYVRVQTTSKIATEVGNELVSQMKKQKDLFKFKVPDNPPILLILDRRDDPVTPLLTHWTYQVMIHEMIGIKDNMVNLVKTENDKPMQITLSQDNDSFYRENMYKNFGDLGVAIKTLVDEYQKKAKTNQNVKSLDDIKSFVRDYPDFKKLSGNVSKHMALMEALQSHISKNNLLELSELEQSFACEEKMNEHTRALEAALSNKEYNSYDLARLATVYMLRYETNVAFDYKSFIEKLSNSLTKEDLDNVKLVYKYCGVKTRSSEVDLFENKHFLSKTKSNLLRGLKGVENIYTQHKPYLYQVLTSLSQNKLSEKTYPYLDGAPVKERPNQILIFMIGGITYDEAAIVAELNAIFKYSPSILLGGTQIHNSKSYLESLKQLKTVKNDNPPQGGPQRTVSVAASTNSKTNK